jgi:hypothetical protein
MSQRKFFKTWCGYEKFIRIDDTELPRVLAAQITGKIVTVGDAQIRGSTITVIEPDYHRAMGWNDGYKLGPEDHADISKHCREYVGYVGKIKEEVHLALGRGDAALLN